MTRTNLLRGTSRRRLGRLTAIAGAALVALGMTTAAAAEDKSSSTVYIVRMSDAPVVAYDGGKPGYQATRPAPGQKVDPNSAKVVRYAEYLDSRHSSALARAGASADSKVYDYRYSFNGFAAKLTPAAVAKLSRDSAVLTVEKAQDVSIDTATTPAFLGLTEPGTGLWSQNIKGENVIIGVVDSGIWPESKSFSDRDANGKRVYTQVPGFHGKCASSETVTDGSWDASNCNRKLVAAQYFCESRGCDTLPERNFLSPRDFGGHGTHTASTAGGNQAIPTTGDTAVFGQVNGIAPRARVAAYKVCWEVDEPGGCDTGDSVAAIDQAVADGVDVLNYSISGTSTNYLNAVEVAFLFAADAGVFVAASAGNSGPTASTVAHISPWLASVAAGTHSRSGTATVTLGNGATYTGASLTDAVGPASLVYSGDVKLPAAPATDAQLCFPGTLDPDQVAGKIVLCDRGVNPRVEKSQTVQDAGGIGMVLRNITASTLNADVHFVPTVHVDHIDGLAIKSYVDTAGSSATAQLSRAVFNDDAPAPDVASFSSRGPSRAGGGDILKPDFMAPGVDILAAVAPPGNAGKDFDLYSGTSMSSPHVAGIGALLTQAKPAWSPAAMRSAVATTADATSRAGLNVPFNVGSGHVRPNLSIDPGLVYDAGFNDYLAFLKGQRLCCASTPSIPALDASDLNQPSIAIGDVAGVQTVKRTVTNVGSSAATYTATVSAPPGFTVSVSPSQFTVPAGGKQSFEVTLTRTTSTLGAYGTGSLTWSDGTHAVRSPIVVRPFAIVAPAEVSGTGTSGSTSYSIKTGYNGPLNYASRGLVPAQTTDATVVDDPTDNFDTSDPAGNQDITVHELTVPAGTPLARISLFDEFTDGADDLDVFVYRGSTLVGVSGGVTSAEQVTLVNPTAATYTIYVHGFETDGPDAAYTLFTWVVDGDAGNMTATGPTTATTGGSGTVEVSWSGLTAGTKYLGQIAYQDGTTTHGTTVVRVDG